MGEDLGLGPAALDGAAGEGPLLAFLRVLSDSADRATIGDAPANGLLHEFSPTQVSAYLLDPTRAWLDEVVTYGLPTDGVDYSRVAMELRMPLTEVVRTGEAGVWTTDKAVEQYPLVAGWVQAQPELAGDEVFVVPVRSAGRVIGALLVNLPQRTERSWRLRLLLDSAAIALGLWSRGVMSQAASDVGRARKAGAALSDRQRAIVEGIRAGRSNREIAAVLNVSVGTVKADLAQLYRVFAVSDRDALAALVEAVR